MRHSTSPTTYSPLGGSKVTCNLPLSTPRFIGDANRSSEEVERELRALEQRSGNLPESLAEMRRQLCADLRLPERDVPFVAELVAVRPEERAWEASIEMVLRGFALSLLVPQRHYPLVSAYVDRSRLRDARGRGQRLVYFRVAERVASVPRALPGPQSLLAKLRYQDGHQLLPWVKAELEDRADYLCCDNIEEFQRAHGNALTRDRHVKSRGQRHEKDDREHASHPSRFVLGWDNREKRRHLAVGLAAAREALAGFDRGVADLNGRLAELARRQSLLAEVERVSVFDEIDFARHDRQIENLEAERRSLEENNEVVRLLKQRLEAAEQAGEGLQVRRDALMQGAYELQRWVAEADRLLQNAEAALRTREASGELAAHRASFPDLSERLGGRPPSADDLVEKEQSVQQALRAELEQARRELAPLHAELCGAMVRYLRAFTDEQADLGGTPEYLTSFRRLLQQIESDDLPRHERRFKERLNEKVTHEIGLLHAALQGERGEIEGKIEVLNQSLRQLQYRPGTFMRLEPRPVRDVEIVAFQDALRECLAHTFEGTLEADEARYLKIEQFLTRLRDEERWREKVTDVRRWFDFAARELAHGTNEERDYYQDSAGQSGGEKAKLAFTILVAAIAYQYDLDPDRPRSDRFHFVVVDEMFSKVDDQHAEYALNLFKQFGLQLLIVAPLDAKARVTEPYVGCYVQVVKDAQTSRSQAYMMTAQEFGARHAGPAAAAAATGIGTPVGAGPALAT